MEVKELMPGDWAIYEKYPFRVGAVSFNTVYDVNGYFITDNVEPITLTDEILKTNGFRKLCEYEWERGISVSNYCFNSDDLGEWFVIKFTASYDGFTWKGCDVNNVHKLQHALRLCGLNELADNFKI